MNENEKLMSDELQEALVKSFGRVILGDDDSNQNMTMNVLYMDIVEVIIARYYSENEGRDKLIEILDMLHQK